MNVLLHGHQGFFFKSLLCCSLSTPVQVLVMSGFDKPRDEKGKEMCSVMSALTKTYCQGSRLNTGFYLLCCIPLCHSVLSNYLHFFLSGDWRISKRQLLKIHFRDKMVLLKAGSRKFGPRSTVKLLKHIHVRTLPPVQ